MEVSGDLYEYLENDQRMQVEEKAEVETITGSLLMGEADESFQFLK